ncbi:MAG: response regulator [Pseudomonadota bacterium]
MEDEFLTAESILRDLRKAGYETTAAYSGLAAVQAAFEARPDLILMDIALSGEMDGIEAACEISQELNVPVIFLTALSDNETFHRAKAADPCGYLLKPYNLQELQFAIELALFKAGMQFRLRREWNLFRRAFENAGIGLAILDLAGRRLKVNKRLCELLDCGPEELEGKLFYANAHPSDKYHCFNLLHLIKEGSIGYAGFESRCLHKNGRVSWVPSGLFLVRDDDGRPINLIFQGQDASAWTDKLEMPEHPQKIKALPAQKRPAGWRSYLGAHKREIERRRQAETALQESEHKIIDLTQGMDEMKTALKVLIEQREVEKKEVLKDMLSTLKQFVFPHLDRLNQTTLNKYQRAFLDFIESNLKHIASPLARRLSATEVSLTPVEISVAALIKEGKSTKETASLLNLSVQTVSTYRKRIRKKFGLVKRKTNLRSYLLSLEQESSPFS